MLRDGTEESSFLKKDNMDNDLFDSIQSSTRESTIQITGKVAKKRPPKVPEEIHCLRLSSKLMSRMG